MNRSDQRIPVYDEIGQRINIGDRAVLFSKHGTHYEGKVVQGGGKRWFEVAPGTWIGGIGSCRIMKAETT